MPSSYDENELARLFFKFMNTYRDFKQNCVDIFGTGIANKGIVLAPEYKEVCLSLPQEFKTSSFAVLDPFDKTYCPSARIQEGSQEAKSIINHMI